jgi:His-Xaa-Ser system radical SAM maturase HxsC
MLRLHARIEPWAGDPAILRIAPRNYNTDVPSREALLEWIDNERDGSSAAQLTWRTSATAVTVVELPASLDYLTGGDIIRVVPSVGEISVLYRRASPHNTMLITENCNSHCIMCSQPPRTADDGYLADIWLETIPLMSSETAELGISGGEPTLLGDKLIEILRTCRTHLPSTAIHVLSNGRLFNYLSFAHKVAQVGNKDLMFGIPLYSDVPAQHEFVVQAIGAYDQTIRGIINLKRCGVRIEVRVVLHRETVPRLPHLARFLTRNLPFADHVALMGLELMGYGKSNADALCVDPWEYRAELRAAVDELRRAQMNVSIYNHQLCVLDRELWDVARRSISDWKNEFAPECNRCNVREQCSGFFASNLQNRSPNISPILD